MRFEISFLLLWNRRSAFLQYCTLLLQKSECFDSPSDMAWQSWHVPTVNVQCTHMPQAQVMALWLHWPCAWGCRQHHGPEKNFSKISEKKIYGIHPIKKVLEKIFFGSGKIFFMPGVGPRPACHIPDPRDSWQQRTLWFSHVIVSLAVNLGLQGYLKIGICWLESENAFRDLIFASLESQECVLTILHSFISKIGMFWLSLWHGWANSACANSASGHVCSNVQCTYMPQAQVMALWLHWPCAWDRPEKIFQNLPNSELWNSSYQKKFWNRFFSGVEKCLSCRGSGHAPRATSQSPGTAGSNVHYGLVMLL